MKSLISALLASTVFVSPACAVDFMGNPTAPAVVYVSSVVANGIGIGDDTTCTGLIANPCFTLKRGVQLVNPSGTVKLNGTVLSPVSYPATVPITTTVTVDAVVPNGAIIPDMSVGGNGATITLQNIIIDPSLDGAGPQSVGINLLTTSTPFTFNMNNVTVRNWITYGIAENVSTLNMTANWNNMTFLGGSVQSAFHITHVGAGDVINVTGGSCTITDLTVVNIGACGHGQGSTAGAVYNFTNYNTTVTSTLGLIGVQANIRLVNAVGHITGGTHVSNDANGSFETLKISQAQFPIDGSSMTNVTVTLNALAGASCLIGNDGATDWTLANNPVIDGCNVTSTSTAEGGSFFGGVVGGIIRNSTTTGGTIPFGAKECLNCQFLNNTGINSVGTGFIEKGNNGTIATGNLLINTTTIGHQQITIENNVDYSCTITGISKTNPGVVTYTGCVSPYATGMSAYITAVGGMTQVNGNTYPVTKVDATHFSIGVDTTGFSNYTTGGNTILATAGGTYTGNTFTNNGATNLQFMFWQLGSLIGSIGTNTYNFLAGTLNAAAYATPTANYADCTDWRAAVEITAICNP